ncbi:MAG: amino acid adenylation domain-containing protein [Methylacidiphilales bacterium]|nr:amino acid adenylation domain-containing protein [Candidatus Methylacidiphilales bacterium]
MKPKPESESGARTIRELIDHRADLHPDLAFLIGPETGRKITFRELREESVLISNQLRQLGLEFGDKIAFLMDNGLFTAQLFLGAMYGGLVSVPLNVRAGASQLTYTLEHSDAKVVFVEEKYSALIKEVLAGVSHVVRVIPANVDCLIAETGFASATPLPVLSSDDTALLMYTSGSTGKPKAAIHTHATILAGARNSVVSHKLTSADRSLLVLPLYHINAECVTLIPTLMSGGSVVVPHHFAVGQFWDLIDEYHCTWSALVPTIISQLLDWKDPRADNRQDAFRRIRFLRSSSAPLSPSLHREFLDKFNLPLIQAMGSTEAGNIFSNPVPPGTNKIGSPGLPWGFEARIVDREGADVPVGEPGEVLLRGPAMTRGYYKDPVGTAAAFDSEDWLHTGDLAYRDKDGYFFVVGRSKELIIKGGMNIAPKQIDEVLESHPAVLEAAAVGVPDRYVGEDLVAFAVLRDGLTCDERELLTFCENRLGHFKTPTRIHFVDDLPKGPSGKVQRLRLVEEASKPSVARSVSLGGEPAAAVTDTNGAQNGHQSTDLEIEKIIAGIWSDLLAQPNIEAQGNFFALGGHSLLAIQCLSRMREKIPVILSLTDFFENATVAEQAALVRKRMSSSPAGKTADSAAAPVDTPPIPLRDRSHPCPLSPAQQRIWFVEQLAPTALAYNESEAVRLTGDLDADALERAFNLIVGRHELLRSTIQVSNGQPTFVVHENWPLDFKRIDLSAMPAREREAEMERLLVSEPRGQYHLESSPGIRTALIRMGPRDHVFILMMHHIVCDWSSEGVLWRELSASYRSLLRGEQPNLPPLPIQHGDYAAWLHEQYASTTFDKELAFWKEALRGARELLELPTDRSRPAIATNRGAKKRYRLDATQTKALRQLSRTGKTSQFTVFAAVLDVLLHRYTRNDDILLGIPLADRDQPELQSMIGFLLHTHVLRATVSENMTFSELLFQVQKATLELFNHRAVPFDLVVREIDHERNLSYSPLFQVMLNWRDREQELSFIGMEGLKVESLLAESRTSKFDLTFMVTDEGEELWLEMEYSTDLFDEARIDRMVGHYQTLLMEVSSNPDRRLSDLPLLTDEERRKIVVEWNRTEADYPKDRCLPDLIEEQAMRTPEAVAVVFENQRLTYRELNTRANQLARHLQKLGVGPDALVGICVDRSLEMVVGMLGILKAGGAYVPLDPKYPKERIAFVLEDAAARVLLTQSHLVEMMAPCAQTIRLDADWPRIASESDLKVESKVTGENLAYVIYTSGSTGMPKGVEIPHRALVNFLVSMEKQPGLTSKDVLLAVTTFSFDIAGLEIFLPLMAGARLVLLSRDDAADGFRVLHHLNAHKATFLQATPSTWRMLLDAEWPGSPQLKMLCGGEALPRELATQLLAKGGEFWNMYGPTETTIWSSATQVARDDGPIHIGRPIANTQLYILDPHLQPVPAGVPGELHIGGTGLARGYHNRSELTAEKFIPDPFSGVPGARLYKTGDLARFLPDGNVEYLGRLDHQIKIRGFRVELGEIEEVLNQHPGVQASVVMAREDAPGDKRLVAYVVNRNGAVPSSELRECIRAKLPDYMMPSAFVTLKAFPLTPNGKVDRKALPKPDVEAGADKSTFVKPRTRTENALAEIWREVLSLKHVGIRDTFFELGGHSMLAVRLVSKINKSLGLGLPILVLFQNPTIEKLANVCDRNNQHNLEPKLRDTDESDEAMVTVQAKGSRPPLFFLHGDWVGGGFYCGRLSQELGEDQPFYSLPPYLSGKQSVPTMEERVAHHLGAIREQSPHGPYLLGGYCIGAMIAVEIARQLVKEGEKVTHLLLLDPPLFIPWLRMFWPFIDKTGSILRWSLQKKIHYFERALSLVRWSGMTSSWKIATLCRLLGIKTAASSKIVMGRDAEGDISILGNFNYAVYFLVSRLFQLKPLSVPVTLYIPKEAPPSRFSLQHNAGEYFPDVTIKTVPGNHHTCITKFTSALVEKMKKTLDTI